MKTHTYQVDESQYMPYEFGDMEQKRKPKTPEYYPCPYGCKSQWYTKAAAKKCTCQITRSQRAPKKLDPVRTPEQLRKMAIWEIRFAFLQKQIYYKRHMEKKHNTGDLRHANEKA